MSQERRTITVTEVIRLLDEGMHRPQIAEHFGLTMSDVNKLFKNAALKGKKARKAPGFVLVDDTQVEEQADTQVDPQPNTAVVEQEQEVQEEVVDTQESDLAQEDSVEETRATNSWNN